MKFLDKIGLGKKKKEEEKEEAKIVEQPKTSRLSQVIKALNSPMGGAIGFNPSPKRTPMEKQLGIPEFVAPQERAPDFSVTPKTIPKPKQVRTSWRPRPGVPNKKGDIW